MSGFVPWNSQSISNWSKKYAKGKFIDLDGHSTHYLKKGEGVPIILIHGFNMDMNTWTHNIEALAANHSVYAFDLWGMGYSTREAMDTGYPLFAEQLLQFMDALEIDKATLVGHSIGAGTAIYFAVHNPDRVARLVLVDSTGIPNPLPLRSKFFTLPGVGEFLLGINNNYFRRKNLNDIWFHEKYRLTDEVFRDLTQFQKVEGSSEILLQILRRDFFHTLSEEIKQLSHMDIPTLIVWGRYDVSIPLKIGREMHSILEGSSFEVIDNGGHMPNWDSPAQFNQIVMAFIGEPLVHDRSQVAMVSMN